MSGKQLLKSSKSEWQLKEEKRKKVVAAALHRLDSLSSEMNACQALVKADCSKPRISKASTISEAIKVTLCSCIGIHTKSLSHRDKLLKEHNLIFSCTSKWEPLPDHIAKAVKVCSIEFAGVVFKTKAITGLDYIKSVNQDLETTLSHMPGLTNVVICEEKYRFTPDTFKSHTRKQRSGKQAQNIHHLKSGKDILSSQTFNKEACITSREGKSLVTTYLAQNSNKISLHPKQNLKLDIDSELIIANCNCSLHQKKCQCANVYSIPIRCHFTKEGAVQQERLDIRQLKGGG